ncbi:MAG: TraR/DksA C4-type zinc finger protein [Verrucomicrobiae bacterium]|nr:TraR/DksA C4-type zinc finger protein [Verrucomicrobiae bacterium]
MTQKKRKPRATDKATAKSSKASTNRTPENERSGVQDTGNKVQTTVVSPVTTEAILGRPMSRKSGELPHIKPQWVKYYQRLLDLRERLLQQMQGLAKESAEEINNFSLHMADAGTDNFDRDFALSLLSSDQDALYEIDEALKRLEKGTYGICEITGKPIPKARLDAIPWARFTVEAQTQLEREGALRHKRLANLGSIDTTGALEVEEEFDEEDKPIKE